MSGTRSTTAWTFCAPCDVTEKTLTELDIWSRAARCLSVGQICPLDNPLLPRPLIRGDIKPRLLGHWGTTPGSSGSTRA